MMSLSRAKIFILLLFLISCRSPDDEKYVIGFSQPMMSDLWRRSMVEEMRRQLLLHDDLEFIFKDAHGENSTQINQIQELIEEGIDLLIVSPKEVEPIGPIVESVYKRGIPVVVLDRRINSDQYTAYVGGDNVSIGKEAAEYIARHTNFKGRVLELHDTLSVSAFSDRHNGFRLQMSSYHDIKVDSCFVMARGLDDFKRLLNTNAYKAIFAHTDRAGRYAYMVADSLNKTNNLIIVGVDGLPGKDGGLELVQEGILTASMLYSTGGDVAIEVASAILHHRPFEKENILESTVIDKDNVKAMQMQAAKLAEQQKNIENLADRLYIITDIFQTQQMLTYLFALAMVIAMVIGIYAFKSLQENRRINHELKAKNDQITEYSQKAEEATQAKFRFFTNISHEFKTPLTLINAPIEDMLANRQASPFHGDLRLIRKNAQRLLRLVNQLMDFRKIDNSKMPLNISVCDLVSFLRDIMNSFQKLANERNISLKLLAKDQEISLWIDQNMMDKVIFNILSNAFKFTPSGGSIKLDAVNDVSQKAVKISIEDSGPGMSKEELEHVFDRFYQGRSNRDLGTGLGLSLSKELIELHHGQIVASGEPGKGTRFEITLPAGKDHFSEGELTFQSEHILEEDLGYLDDTVEPGSTFDNKHNKKDHSVLVIEDNNELRNYLVSRLEMQYEVLQSREVAEGINVAFDSVPDLIICDLMLQDESGFEVIKKLKSDVRSSHIPIIILSAKSSTEDRILGIKLGADDYIIKPFNYSILKERIKMLLVSRRRLREHYLHALPVDQSQTTSLKIDKKFVNTFASIVEENLSNPNFGVNEMSDALGLSRVQLYRKVKAILGYSVNDYINNVRLKRAKHFMLHDNMTVSEIAYQVGYSTPAYFSTAFKNHFGLTPSEFRDQNRK